jgi:hypothetical protein
MMKRQQFPINNSQGCQGELTHSMSFKAGVPLIKKSSTLSVQGGLRGQAQFRAEQKSLAVTAEEQGHDAIMVQNN